MTAHLPATIQPGTIRYASPSRLRLALMTIDSQSAYWEYQAPDRLSYLLMDKLVTKQLMEVLNGSEC